MLKLTLIIGMLSITTINYAQTYWQQAVDYNMDIELKVKKNCIQGNSEITYFNNSPDTLNRLFMHLYFNAFQPNSMMDQRSMTIADPDRRVGDRISKLTEKETGYYDFKKIKVEGEKVNYTVDGTILDIQLDNPVLPNTQVTIELKYVSQVPIQIRRSGRDNAEGVRFSMSQWYPKLCEYDVDGWHPNPYIGREFYGIWGDFDVSIQLDKDYYVAAGGTLMNDPSSQKGGSRTWRYRAENVHDIMWAADPDYVMEKTTTDDGIEMRFVYQPGENTTSNWQMLPEVMAEAFSFIQKRYGKYPYPSYSFIQGGDGGMEYPMGTLITGERSFTSLVGVSVHELMHSWYQMVLGTNEALYPWMDEGFTSYASSEVMNHLKKTGKLKGLKPVINPHAGSMTGYRNFASTPFEEPLTTHADHYKKNQAYGIASYVKGAVFLDQLSYIVGQKTFDKIMLRYYNQWKFKHPDIYDFIRVAEKESGFVLDWYVEKWVASTDKIDYAIESVSPDGKETKVNLSKLGDMMMPLDVHVRLKSGRTEIYNVPLRLMRGAKQSEGLADDYTIGKDWPWTQLQYTLSLPINLEDIESIEIDASNRLADIDVTNNKWPLDLQD